MKFILGIYVTQTHLACVVGANRGAGRGGGDGEKREKEKERQIQIKIDLRKVCEPARLSNPHKPFFLFTKTAGHKTSPGSICYIVITPLSFFLCPNPLPPMTPARLDPTNPSPPFPLREPHRCSTSVPSECKGLFHQKTLLLTKTEFEWLACFQVQSYRLNHWGEKFCFLDGRSRTQSRQINIKAPWRGNVVPLEWAVIFLSVKSALLPFRCVKSKNVFVFASRLRESFLSLSFGSYPFHVPGLPWLKPRCHQEIFRGP